MCSNKYNIDVGNICTTADAVSIKKNSNRVSPFAAVFFKSVQVVCGYYNRKFHMLLYFYKKVVRIYIFGFLSSFFLHSGHMYLHIRSYERTLLPSFSSKSPVISSIKKSPIAPHSTHITWSCLFILS